jgi:transcriptional regulator of nitric oxide reductase
LDISFECMSGERAYGRIGVMKAGQKARVGALVATVVVWFPLTAYRSPLTAQDAPAKKVQASLARVFGDGVLADTVTVDDAPVLRVERADSLLGYAVVRNVKGKDQPITFLVAVDPGDHLKDVDILVYREPYGGEVAYDSWRKQFRGKTAQDPMEVGKDIRSISGATISVNSVTLAVRKAVADLTAWHAAGKLQ